jgi:tryptophan synthase beta subunit
MEKTRCVIKASDLKVEKLSFLMKIHSKSTLSPFEETLKHSRQFLNGFTSGNVPYASFNNKFQMIVTYDKKKSCLEKIKTAKKRVVGCV